MEALVVPDVEQRGLELGIQALTPHERDVFAVWDVHLYLEMEGSFVDHIPNAPETFDWLEGTLERIGDLGSLRLIRSVRELKGNELSRANALCQEYADRADFRMARLERYMLNQGVKLAWTRNDA